MMQLDKIKIGDLIIDPHFHVVTLAGEEIYLYPKEFEVLYYLSQHPGWVLSAVQIYEAVWREEGYNCNSIVCYIICQLRKKLKRPEMIQTVRKYGYKFNG